MAATLPPLHVPDAPAPGLVSIGVYERRVALSRERVYENALDWEHLPWLHAQDFASIDLFDAGDWGWRARVERPPAGSGSTNLELLLNREVGAWVSRAIGASDRSGEIWTWAREVPGVEATDLSIEFFWPETRLDRAEQVAALQRDLYARLWDQDEAMSWHRERAMQFRRRAAGDASSEIVLGAAADVVSRTPYVVELGGRRWCVSRDTHGELTVFAADCPHWLGPLVGTPDSDGCITCPWHGYRFDTATGSCEHDAGLRLPTPPALVIDDGVVRLVSTG